MTEPSTQQGPSAEQDQQLEIAIGLILRVGVSVAATVVLLGGLLYLVHSGPAPDYTHFHAAPAEVLSIHGTLIGAAHRSGLSIIQLGVLLLIATPIARVVLALAGFAREGDQTYAWISTLVLTILLLSLLLSR